MSAVAQVAPPAEEQAFIPDAAGARASRALRVNAILSGLVTRMASGDVTPIAEKYSLLAAGADRPCLRWSLSNYCAQLDAGTMDARGARQWQKVGRYLKKGCRALYIISPVRLPIKEKAKPSNEVTEASRLVFTTTPVFSVEDTLGKPLEGVAPSPISPPSFSGVAAAWGIDVVYSPGRDQFAGLGGYGYYRTGPGLPGRIVLHTADPAGADHVFLHELSHAAHDRVLIERDGKGLVGDSLDTRDRYLKQEAVAEIASAVLSALQGAPRESGAYAYLKMLAHEQKLSDQQLGRMIMGVLDEVDKVVMKILIASDLPDTARDAISAARVEPLSGPVRNTQARITEDQSTPDCRGR